MDAHNDKQVLNKSVGLLFWCAVLAIVAALLLAFEPDTASVAATPTTPPTVVSTPLTPPPVVQSAPATAPSVPQRTPTGSIQRYAVQVAGYSGNNRLLAETMLRDLTKAGFPAYDEKRDNDFVVVFAGPFTSRARATEAIQWLRDNRRINDAFITTTTIALP